MNIQKIRGHVICEVLRTGTHENTYSMSNHNHHTILTKSEFLKNIENIQPTKLSYKQPATIIFSFEGECISQILFEEEPLALVKQLKLDTYFATIPKTSKEQDFEGLKKAINALMQEELTKKEMICLALSLSGLSAKHIAEFCRISHRTVETHLMNVYDKLGCCGKQQVIELMISKRSMTIWLEMGKMIFDNFENLFFPKLVNL
jgi:DNA-binding CsgD family transcriptional regulator